MMEAHTAENAQKTTYKTLMALAPNAVQIARHAQEVLHHVHHAMMVTSYPEIHAKNAMINANHAKDQAQHAHHAQKANSFMKETALLHVLH